jgi:hypothetical protein
MRWEGLHSWDVDDVLAQRLHHALQNNYSFFDSHGTARVCAVGGQPDGSITADMIDMTLDRSIFLMSMPASTSKVKRGKTLNSRKSATS